MPAGSDVRPDVARFGVFEVDLSKGEVRRDGRPVALQRHSFLVLATLLERAGEEVSRDTLRGLLWPGVEFLDFENGINSAVARLRQALGDSADSPRFIGTRRGYGYRLLVPVTWVVPPDKASIHQQVTRESAAPAAVVIVNAAEPRPRWRRPVLWGALVLAILSVGLLVSWVSGLALLRSAPTASDPASTEAVLSVYPQPGLTLTGSFALSPDGRRLVIVVAGETPEATRLWLRALDSVAERPLPGTEGAAMPFWSPDGRSIGFFAHGALKTIALESGRVVALAPAPRGRGGTWSAAGVILFAPDLDSAIWSVPAGGGPPVAVTDVAASPSHRFPSFLPDGLHFIYLVLREDRDASEIWWGRLGGPETGRLLTAGSNAVCTRAGQIFFARGSALFAQAIDAEALRPLGLPVLVGDRVGVYGEEGPTGLGAFSVSADGTVATTDVLRPAVRLSWFDRQGHQLPTAGPAGDFISFDLAADESHVTVARFDPRKRSSDLFTIDLRTGVQTQVTDDPWPDASVSSAPAGSRVAFQSLREGRWTSIVRDTSQVGAERRLGAYDSVDSWFPDAEHVLCERRPDAGGPGVTLWKVPVGRQEGAVPILQGASLDGQARISPDGRWLAYTSDVAAPERQLYVVELGESANAGGQSLGPGLSPRWRRDGRELFFLSKGRLMSVPVAATGTTPFGTAQPLFEPVLPPHDSLADFPMQFAVSGDGSRVLFAVPIESERSGPIRITRRAGLALAR